MGFEKCKAGLGDALWVGEMREERDELVYGMMYLKNVVERVMVERSGELLARYLNKMHRYLESVEDFYVDCN